MKTARERSKRTTNLSELRSLRDFDRPADRIRQHRQVSSAPVLIVEGTEDYLVLRSHLPGVEIFPADGKPNVIDAARTLQSWAVERFLCVTDPDFDSAEEIEDISSVHHPYRGRDLEAMLIAMGVLATVLEHQGSARKIAALGGPDALIHELKTCVAPVTALRRKNASEGWGLAFDKVDMAGKIDRDRLRLRSANYCAALLQASTSTISSSAVLAEAEHAENLADYRGKDVMVAAGVALRKRAGTLPQAATVESILSAQLRSSCGLALSKSEWLAELLQRVDAT